MQSLKRTLFDLCLLGVLSIAIGFGANAVRERGAIKPTKNYFEKTAQTNPQRDNGQKPTPKTPPSSHPPTERSASGTTGSPIEVSKTPPAVPADDAKHLEHDYQEIRFPELVKVFQDPATAQGLNLFVDARKPDLYEEGHIPGAVRSYPFEAGKNLNNVVALANGRERVIVYCGGGDCEDSIFMCRELVDAGVPYDSIFLYPGGWKEWSANQMPVEEGSEEP